MPLDPVSGIWFELHGRGTPLMITLPLMATHMASMGPDSEAVLRDYLALLTDRFQILLVDYPSIGKSLDIKPEELTADRVCHDLLSVATAAGFDDFAYWGYSWGGAIGLQLAARTDRLTALIIGGWPPLNAPYANILAASRRKIGNVPPGSMVILRSQDQYRQWSFYYESMIDWPEAEAVAAMTLPRLVYFGAVGDLVEANLPINIASIIRQHRGELEAKGWQVIEFVGEGHGVCMKPGLIVPPIAAFLDEMVKND